MPRRNALLHMIEIFGDDELDHGGCFSEPRITPRQEGPYEHGQTLHIVHALSQRGSYLANPNAHGTQEAERWVKGRFIEMETERWVVEAYSCATRYMVLP